MSKMDRYFDKPEDYPYILERLLSYHFHEVYLVKASIFFSL